MVSDTDSIVHFTILHGNKTVKVTAEFPQQSDQKAEQEFISRLKAIYLEKILASSDKRDGEE